MLKRLLSRQASDGAVEESSKRTRSAKTNGLGSDYRFIKCFDIFAKPLLEGRMLSGLKLESASGDQTLQIQLLVDQIVKNARDEYGTGVVDVLVHHFNQSEDHRDFQTSLFDVLRSGDEDARKFDLDDEFLKRLDLRDEYYEFAQTKPQESKASYDEQVRTIKNYNYLAQTERLVGFWGLKDEYRPEVRRFIGNCTSSALCRIGQVPTSREHIVVATLLHVAYYNSKVKVVPSLAARFFKQERERMERASPNERLYDIMGKMIELGNFFPMHLAAVLNDWDFLKRLVEFAEFLFINGKGANVLQEAFENETVERDNFLSSILSSGRMDLYEDWFQTTTLIEYVDNEMNEPEDIPANQNQEWLKQEEIYDQLWDSGIIIQRSADLSNLAQMISVYAPVSIWTRFLEDIRVFLNSASVYLAMISLAAIAKGGKAGETGRKRDAELKLRAALKVQNKRYTFGHRYKIEEVDVDDLLAYIMNPNHQPTDVVLENRPENMTMREYYTSLQNHLIKLELEEQLD